MNFYSMQDCEFTKSIKNLNYPTSRLSNRKNQLFNQIDSVLQNSCKSQKKSYQRCQCSPDRLIQQTNISPEKLHTAQCFNITDNKEFVSEVENDNYKLQFELTKEKKTNKQLTKIIQVQQKKIKDLSNIIYENEIKLKTVIRQKEIQFSQKIDSIYKEFDKEKEKIQKKVQNNYIESNKSKEKRIDLLISELCEMKNIIKNFFNFFNKFFDLYSKTGIANKFNLTRPIFFNEDSKNHENERQSHIITGVLEMLINKLIVDNKNLYNDNKNMKKKLIEVNKSTDFNKTFDSDENKNSKFIQQNFDSVDSIYTDKISVKEQEKFPDYNDQQEFITNNLKIIEVKNKNRSISPIDKLKMKIDDIEQKYIRNKYINN